MKKIKQYNNSLQFKCNSVGRTEVNISISIKQTIRYLRNRFHVICLLKAGSVVKIVIDGIAYEQLKMQRIKKTLAFVAAFK